MTIGSETVMTSVEMAKINRISNVSRFHPSSSIRPVYSQSYVSCPNIRSDLEYALSTLDALELNV